MTAKPGSATGRQAARSAQAVVGALQGLGGSDVKPVRSHHKRGKRRSCGRRANFPSTSPGRSVGDQGDAPKGVSGTRGLELVMKRCDLKSVEINGIRDAARNLRLSLRGYKLYTTCDPGPISLSARIWAE